MAESEDRKAQGGSSSVQPSHVGALLELKAKQNKQRYFLLFEDQKISYAEMDERANRVANGLRGLGIEERQGIAVNMGNRPEYLYAYYGISKMGGYFVPVNTALKGEGLAYIISHSDSVALILGWELVDNYSFIRDELNALQHVIVDTNEAPADFALPAGCMTLQELMDTSAETPSPDVKPEDLAMLMYTSGTTGLPKGVVFRQRAFTTGIVATRRDEEEETDAPLGGGMYSADSIMYTCLPLFHGNALMLSVHRGLVSDATVALSRRFSASRFWDEVRKHNANTFNALGAMIPILCKQPEKENDADNPIKFVLSAACPASVWKPFEERFDVKILEGYGAVDGGGSLMNPPGGPPGSMGKPGPETEVQIVDDNDDEVGPDVVGEMIMRAKDPALRRFPEYYKNPEATKAKSRGGWVRTGDLAYRNEDGWFFFVDRKSEFMRRRGENISSFEVEREVNKHPKVLESAAFGVPTELGEDDVMVAVVLKPGETLKPEELLPFLEERMAYFMVPRYVDIVEGLPKTGTHRTQKHELKKQGVTASTWDREKAGYKVKR
jgi:crotonobetaine/carnitine-CoA ligase